MFGLNFLGPLGMATQGDGRPDNSPVDMAALQKMLADTKAANRTPNGRVARGWDQFAPQAADAPPMIPAPVPAPVDMGPPPALSPQAMQGPPVPPPAPAAVPMPQPRPPEAPQEMGFFQRNAAMMQDPSSGAFLDPGAAERAQASGPDVINKLLSYFHDKAQ